MTEGAESEKDGPPASPRPLFRHEAMAEPPFGEPLAFPTPGWGSLRWLGLATGILFVGFSLLADFDRTATARGLVVPSAGISRVVAPQPGIITSVLVRQGAVVQQGTPLVRIASRNFLPTGAADPEAVVETFRDEHRLAVAAAEAEARRRRAERQRLQARAAELAAARRSLQAQIVLQRSRIQSNAQRLASLAPLRASGFVSELTFQEQEEKVLTLRQQLAALEQQEGEATHGLEAARAREAELAADGRRAELEGAARLLGLERGAARAQTAAEITITAPVSGTVSALPSTPGLAVAVSDPVATIVPAGDELEVLLFVPPRSAGFLRPGQPVTLRYDAFPYHRFGVGHGFVTEVAAAASPEAMTGSEPSYRVRVRLDGTSGFALRPDMTLSASIILERRSLAEWIFEPLRQQLRQRVERSAR